MMENMSKSSSKRDVSVVFDLHRVLRKRSPKAMLFSIFAVALLLIGPLSLVIAGIGESSADGGYVGNKMTITYHPYEEGKEPTITSNYNSSGEYGSISVTYYGDFASTEYNPQLWSSDVADGGSSALYSAVLEHGVNLKKWYPIKSYNKGKTIVFTGWVYSSGNVKKEYDPGDIVNIGECTDGKIDLYATWGELKNHTNVLKTANKWKDGTVYTNIFEFDSIELTENTFFNNNNNNKTIGPNYTLRGKTSDSTIDLGDKNVKGYINISGKTIIDNCIIKGTKGDNNHGEGDTGIFANGNKLIIGSNVKGTPNGSTEANYAQIFGGSKTGDCDPTNLIIHSGTFSNVVSGSQNGIVKRNTKVILKDVTILDTLTAGVDSKVDGSTYIYASAINMPGDSYEEGKLESNDLPGGVTLTESTIITGGCNRAEVTGDTHVFIAGTSKIWDVQGAGRGGGSSVNKSNVTIGGKAVVKHIVAGSITDGMNSGGDKQCVKNTNITVKDQSIVCSVFGAGYDTFYKAEYASMIGGGE